MRRHRQRIDGKNKRPSKRRCNYSIEELLNKGRKAFQDVFVMKLYPTVAAWVREQPPDCELVRNIVSTMGNQETLLAELTTL